MLITFKSSASNDVSMFESDAKAIFRLIGKPADVQNGIVTVDQLTSAIASLRLAIADDKAEPITGDDETRDMPTETEEPVSLRQRAHPVLVMLERSLKEGVPVVWGG